MVRTRTKLILALSLLTACSDGFVSIDSAPVQVQLPDSTDPQANTPSTPNTPADGPEGMCALTVCGDACVDTTSDALHCGGCFVACNGACVASVCDDENVTEPEPDPSAMCTVGELCGTECIDTNQNSQHCGACDRPCSGGQVCVDGGCATLTEIEGVLLETNQVRAMGADCGVYGTFAPTAPLSLDENLVIAAQAHALDMSANDFFSHTGSDGSSFSVRVGRTAFSGQPIGENIAAGQRSPAAVVQSWVNSDGHCRNMMNPSATKIGIGYTTGGPYGTLWVQVFGR